MTVDTLPYQTPFRHPQPVLTGSGIPGTYNEQAVDCPFVFRHRGHFHMLHLGFDGRGYQTALAISDDLISWTHYATILQRHDDSQDWDRAGAAGTWLLRASDDLDGIPRLLKLDGRYWLLYHSYPGTGYENGPAKMSWAWCEDEDLRHWHRLGHPVLSWEDGAPWEQGGLYRGAVIRANGRFAMLYNAKDRQDNWLEKTGLAWSDDLIHWTRHGANPVLEGTPNAWDWRFVSDPYPVRHQGRWLNFYFGYDGHHAQEGLAWSDDLIHWEKLPQPLLSHGNAHDWDETHAHKAAVFRHHGKLYHFYCGVRPAQPSDTARCKGNECRTILLATD